MAGLLVFQVGSDWSLLLATRVRSSSYGVAAVCVIVESSVGFVAVHE
jgi:hypothetical protein